MVRLESFCTSRYRSTNLADSVVVLRDPPACRILEWSPGDQVGSGPTAISHLTGLGLGSLVDTAWSGPSPVALYAARRAKPQETR